MDMALPVVNATAAVLARVSAAFNAPLARAVVFGVHIDGKSLFPHGFIRRVGGLVSHIQSRRDFPGHLVVEGLLIAVIVFQLSRKSYKPPKKPLTEKVRTSCVLIVRNY
jgi:serine palmitoyltransferase